MTQVSDERLIDILSYTPTHADNKADRVFFRDLRLIITELQQLRAHNSDSAEPVAWRVSHGGGVTIWNVESNAKSNVKLTGGVIEPLYLASPPAKEVTEAKKFPLGTRVTKKSGSSWTGLVVGFYSTKLTPIGYAVESENEAGSVQIYPETALANRTPDDEVGNGPL